jgi:CheY-like chemotaxis protein
MEFADTGCGISPDEIARAFEPFEQTRSGRFQGSGTGLGLPISREYARMMGGDLVVESVVGTGSRFRFTFRAKVAHESDLRKSAGNAARQVVGLVPSRPAPRVLVVDDDEASRDALKLHLEIVGFRVREASNGREAVAVTEEWRPEVVLMDLWMPEMDGLEATRRIKATPAGPTTPVLAVTASVLEESQKDAIMAGADGFIRKPFRKSEVFAELKRVLGVEYVYEDVGLRADDAPGADWGKTDVSAALVRELTDAAESGDGRRLRRVLDEHRTELGAEVAQMLADMANSYRYAEVLTVLAGMEVGGRSK